MGKQNTLYAPSRYVTPKSAAYDAFGRQRVSNIVTIFDSKQIHSKQPLFWDDQETAGGGTGSTWTQILASTRMTVAANTAGTRVRQTFQRFNYQPGKSLLPILTCAEFDTTSGLTKRFGYFDEKNGLFFQSKDGVLSVVRRTYTSGAAVDEVVKQSDWNVDKFDGIGASGITLDPSKDQIGYMDIEWLGVGDVRIGFVIGGSVYYCHVFTHANVLTAVYMSTPNLPLRYEITNDGTGAADGFVHICSSVNVEGGVEKTGILRHQDSVGLTGLATGTTYAAVGIRLNTSYLDSVVEIEDVSLIATTPNDQAHWELNFNPTVAGVFTYAALAHSTVETATGTVLNTVTNGIVTDGGYFSTATPSSTSVRNALKLGSTIAGVADQLILTVRPITNNISVQASITWRELS